MKVLTPPPRDYRALGPERFQHILDRAFSLPDPYLHWDKLRHKDPPGDLSPEEWWYAIKLGRSGNYRPVPLMDSQGRKFVYSLPDRILSQHHWIDSKAHGAVLMDEQVTGDETRNRYIISSIMEEAITSSQLEGASTTRPIAKEMLRTGRRPADRSERMIFNNYQAMQYIRTELRGVPLTPDAVKTLQAILTTGTLDKEDAVGRLQRPGEDRVGVWDNRTGTLLHMPPPAAQLPERLAALCDFANAPLEGNQDRYVPPIVHAVILHFWLAYDHPFVDGNGRTARAIFYWAMLKHGYWLVEFLSISRLLYRGQSAYFRSFQYTETDGNDLTYFILYQFDILRRTIDGVMRWLKRKAGEVRRLEQRMRSDSGINYRQRALLAHALRHPGHVYTIQSHRRSHNVVYATSHSDLMTLVRSGLLRKSKKGRALQFTAVPDLEVRLDA